MLLIPVVAINVKRTIPQSGAHGDHRQSSSRITTIAWRPNENLEYPDWVAAGRRLGLMVRASQWWIGDWIRYGTAKWGEKYVEAARITGYDQHSLRNMAYVASRVDLSLRSDKLTWSHHVLLAPLEPDEQRQWLERAQQDRLSVEDLRIELRTALRGIKRGDTTLADDCGQAQARAVVCPNCGQEITLQACS